jgi:hypothetical protein
VVHVILPLILGLLVYLFYRSNTWLNYLVGQTALKPVIVPGNFISRILAFNVPDFCWFYSFSSAFFIWEHWWGRPLKLLSYGVLVLLIASELVQLLFPLLFTFDPVDILAAILAFTLSFIQLKHHAED